MHENITPTFLKSQGFSPTIIERFWNKIKKTKSCWIWIGATYQGGYGKIFVRKTNGKTVLIGAHVLSWIFFNGKTPKHFVLHRCDNPRCVNPSHLFAGTAKDNTQDMIKKGRDKIVGENNWKSKISLKQAEEIRHRCANGQLQKEVAKIYHLSKPSICRIVNHKSFKPSGRVLASRMQTLPIP